MANFDIGETVICFCEVKDDAGAYKDPATSMEIGINQVNPSGVIIAATAMTKDATGKYHYNFQTSACSGGKYQAKYIATDGTRITIEKEQFELG